MAEEGTWQPLQLDSGGAPRLILKARLGETGYHVQISDLSRVWEESLSKEAIVKRASDSGCSIDASEDDQYQILLEKMNSAFNRQDGTTLNLRRSWHGEDLELDVTAPLPAALPLFTWALQLSQLKAQAIAVNIVTPLLRQAQGQRDQIHQLIGQLESKDHVISKVTDELEKAGHDLAQVFPVTSGRKTNRKSSQREQLGSYVAGLGEFKREAWQASLVQSSRSQMLSPDTLDTLLREVPAVEDLLNAKSSEWWENLSCAQMAARVDGHEHRSPSSDRHRNGALESSIGELHHGETSLQLKSRASTPSTKGGDTDVETDGEQPNADRRAVVGDETIEDYGKNLDGLPITGSLSPPLTKQKSTPGTFRAKERSRSPKPVVTTGEPKEAQQQPMAKPIKKLGSFAGRREATNSAIPAEASSPRAKSIPGIVADKTDADCRSAELERTPSESLPKPKRKLGMFGGKRSLQTSSIQPAEERATSGPLGGSDGAQYSSVSAAGMEEQSAQPANRGEEAAQKEASEEPPEQKRERLKRELEEKSKAPVRKKRKF